MARLAVLEKAKISLRSVRILMAMLAIDLVFLLVHAMHVRFDVPGSGRWLISRDRGFPELFQYGKELLVIVVTVRLSRRWGSAVHRAWAVGFLYLLLDDSLEIHETVGEWIAEVLGLGTALGVEGRDLGQVLVSASVGLVLATVITVVTVREPTQARELTFRLVVVVAALAFFGVVTDVVDAIDLFGLVEDGGEMVAMSAAVAVTIDHRDNLVRNRLAPERKPVSGRWMS